MKLSDGTVLPSAFRATPASTEHGFEQIKKQDRLKVGTIVAVRTVDSSEGLQKSANQSKSGEDGSPYETVYDVRVDDNNARPVVFVGCRALKPFMGANNYFDMIHESADLATTYIETGPLGMFAAAAESLVGSRCVVLCLEGQPTAGVILGFLQHPARKSKITKDKEVHLEMEFQGMKISIDKDGAFKLEGNGPYIPTIAPPVGPVPESSIRANPLIGPFTIEITKDMQFILKDNKDQMIKVDRDAGEMIITNTAETIKFTKPLAGDSEMLIETKGTQTVKGKTGEFSYDTSLTIKTKELSISADTSAEIKSGDIKFEASKSVSISGQQVKIAGQTSFALETQKMSFKGATGELLAIIKELIEGIGGCTPSSPVGPCAPIQGSPQWAATVATALQKLAGMTG